MAITCALGSEHIEALTRVISKAMLNSQTKGEAFDINDFMNRLYSNLKNRQGVDSATQYMQQVPYIINLVATRKDIELSKDNTGNEINILPLSRAFRNQDSGIQMVYGYFEKTLSPKQLALIAEDNANKPVDQYTESKPVEELTSPTDKRLKSRNVNSGTDEQFLAKDPKTKIEEFEVTDSDKITAINTVSRLSINTADIDLLDNASIDGVNLKLKVIPLDRLSSNDRTNYSNTIVARQNAIISQGSENKATPVSEQFALVLSDTSGAFVYFTKDGRVSTKDEGGRIVYQMLRDVRLENGKYRVTDIYGIEDQIMSPEDIVNDEILSVYESKKNLENAKGMSVAEYIKEVEKKQQEEFKKLYDFRQELIRTKQTKLLSITGATRGVFSFKILNNIMINNLSSYFTEEQRKLIIDSLDVTPIKFENIPSGGSYVTINNEIYEVDRANINEDTARKVAAVLTNPNISNKQKINFYHQFFTDQKVSVPASFQRHDLNLVDGELIFSYAPFTLNEAKADASKAAQNKEPKTINLKSSTAEKDIYDIFMKGATGKNGEPFSSKIVYRSRLVGEEYLDYQDGEFVLRSYSDFLQEQKGRIKVKDGKIIPLYNSSINFTLDDTFVDQVNEAKETVEKDDRSEIRKFKDNLVEVIKNSPDQKVLATVKEYTREGDPKTGTFSTYITVEIEGQQGEHKLMKSLNQPEIGETLELIINPIEIENGFGYPNNISAIKIEGNNIIKYGSLQETDFGKETSRPAVPMQEEYVAEQEEIEELDEVTEAPKTVSEEESDIQQSEALNPKNVGNPSDDSEISNLFNQFKLDRKTTLPRGVTAEQISNAISWYDKSPLKKYLGDLQMINIVNSDAYARFITAGSTLIAGQYTGALGAIQINEATGGSVVDAYHEAWHAFSQLFLTRAEKIALYEELRKSNPKYKNYSFLQLEEILAEDFRSYALNQKTKPSSPKRNSLFRRILNFLRKLFGKTTSISDNLQQYDVESEGVAGELFKNLYLASNNPELLNIYTPSIDNVMFDILNSGIKQTENKNEIALNQKDTNDVVESIDSVISDIIDEQYQREKSSGKDNKAGTTKIITDLNNRKVAYQIAKLKFIEKIDEIKSRLKIAPEKPFTSFSTIKDLEDNASAIIRSKNGDHKYIFLATQIEDYNNLDLATKGDQRVKGELYKDQIEIVGDFYTHKSIKDSTKDNATIIVVNDISEGKEQYDNYIDGGAKSFTSFELNPLVSAESVANIGRLQAKLLDNLRVLQTAVKNWDSVIKYHEKNSSFEIISSTIDLVEDDATTDVAKSEKIGKDIGKESLFELGGKDVIYILRSLHKVTKQGDNYITEKDNLGFKKLVDFKKVWNNLVRITESTKDPEVIYNKIVEASNRFPELKQLVEFKLPKPDSKNNSYEFDNITSFWSVFSLPRVPYMQLSLFKTEGGISTEVTPGSLDVKTVVKQFQYDYKSNKENKYVLTDNNNNVYLNLKKIVNDFADSSRNFDIKKASEFLKVLGITLDNNERINSEITNANKLSRVYGLPYIYDTLKAAQFTDSLERRTEAQDNLLRDLKLNPIGVLINGIDKNLIGEANSRVFKNGSKQKTQIERIAELQVRYGSAPTSFSSTNAERNRINEHTTDNTFTVLIDALNTVEKKTDMYREGSVLRFLDPRKNPMAKSSFVLRNLFDANDNKKSNRSIKYFQQSGTQETNNEATDGGQNTTSLSQQGKLLQEFHTMLKAGHQEIMRPGSKSSAWGWLFEGGFVSRKTIGQKSEPFLYADINSFIPQTGTEREVIEEIILPYLASETNRINVFKSNPEAKNYVGYNQSVNDSGQLSGEVYNYFDGILNSGTKKEILEKVNSPSTDLLDYLKTDPDLYNKIVNEIANYFDKKSVELLDEIKKTEFIDFKLINRFGNIELSDEQRKQVLAKTFFYNSWIHNVETSILFFTGDIAQLDHSKDAAFKRLSGLISNGPRIRTDIYAQLFISNSSEGGFNSNTYAKSLGEAYDKFKYDGYVNTAIIEDISRDSIFMSEIKEGLIADFKRRNSKLSDREIELAVERAVKKYSKSDIKEGDGQGYITIDSYRAIKKLMNKWSPQQENLYKKIINKEEIPLTDYIEGFPVLKLQNFGWVEDTILPVQAMHKFALMPLIPSAVKGTQLEELHKKMLEQNIQYVTFASGSKISGVTSDGKPDQVFENGGKKLKENVTFTNNRINAAFIKEATSVPSKSKGKVIFSTQLRKLILEGLKENGSYVSDKAKELGNKYESLVNFYNELVRKELENEIGYRKDASGTYIGNPAKFLKLIQTNLKAKDYPQHLIDQLKTNSDGTLQYDLSYFLDTETIENIVMSLIEKRLVRQKVNGEALVQIANSMWNGTWDVTQGNKFANLSKEELEAARKKYLGTNGLPFYTKGKDGKTLPMKVAITLQGDFFNLLNLQHLDGQPIKTIKRLNAMIKEDAWLDIADNRKSVTLTAVRIPVQGLNSMEFMEVYEFLDPSAVNMIIPPTEIVAKSGSDFDVDKLTTFFPNINKDGSYVRSSISNQNFFKEVSALENQEKNPKDVISTQKKAAENEFIETIKSILEIEENYASLVTPNDTSILEDIAIRLQDLVSTRDKYAKVNDEKPNVSKKGTKYASPTSIFEPLTNVEKHAQNLEGKRGLGIVANQNALNPLYTSIGAKMPKKYKPAEYKKKYGRYVESKKSKALFDVRLFLPHNEIDGHISLSNIYTNDNIYKIAEIFSQALNGTVDVETNPWIFYIQGNVQALPVFLYLTEAGVSPEDAVYFISNPLIREYTENQRLKGGVFGRASGVAPELAPALKYESAKQVFDKYKERFILDRIKSLSDSAELTIEYFRKNPVTDAPEKVSEKITKGNFINQLPTLAPNLNLVKAEGVAQVIYRNFIPSNKNVYAVSSFLSNIPGVLRRGNFDRNSMFEIIQRKGELSPEQLTKSLAMLAHYVEIENQLRGISALKNLSKPDVKNLRTPQEAIKRELDIDLAFDNSKIDLKTAKGVLEESIIASFGDKDIIEKIFMPMMDLINGPKVNRFLLDALGGYEGNSKLEKIVDSKKYKATQEGLARFNRDFKSGLKTFVFQNYLSNTVFEDGKFVMIPNKYRQQEVKIDNSIDTDVTIKDGVFLINQNRIREDYTNKRYLDTSTSAESYTERQGLEAFPSNENDLFPTEESYIRYVLERENLFQKGLRGDELNQFALINTFNPGVIINPGKYSYSDLVMKTIDKHRSTLSRQFSIIDQIRKYVEAGANKSILTLTNRDVIDGNTATLYASELKQLGNAKIQKVKNTETSPEENERLSRIFKLFPLLMIYQHGVGKTLNGFDNVLPQDDYLKIMKAAGDLFKNNYDNNKTYDFVLDRITDQNNRRFIDFTVTDSQYSQYIPKVLPAEETEVTFEDEEFQQPTQPTIVTTNNPAEFTNHSGGAYGGDTFWDIIGREFGVTQHRHYREEGNKSLSQKLRNAGVTATVLSKEQMDIARAEIKRLLGKEYPNTTEGNLQVRNYYQVANADSVFAIAKLASDKTGVAGGTSTAVQLGIELNKPTYVWDINTESWYRYNGDTFEVTETPTLTKNFAGVGSRDIENYNVKNKETEKWEPRKQYVGDAKSQKAQDAIRDVYAKTFATPTTQPTKTTVSSDKVLEGDIFALPGIPVITTNLGGVHGAGLAQAAKAKGLIKQGEGDFEATSKVVRLPVKKVWSDNMSMNNNMELLKNSLRSLIKVAKANTDKTFLLPLAGLGHGEGSIQDILPLLINTVQDSSNIKLVIPAENVSLGRQGSVRKDYTRENMPTIKAMLTQAGLLGTQPTTQTGTQLQKSREEILRVANLSYLENVLDTLSIKFGLPYEIIYDETNPNKGYVDVLNYEKPTIIINAAKATNDTPLHEYGHIFINLIRTSNKNLYSNLVKEVLNTNEGKRELEDVKKYYSNYTLEEQIDETIVELLGKYAKNELDPNTGIHKSIKKIWDTILEFLSKAFNVNIVDISPNVSIEKLAKLLSNPNINFNQKSFIEENIESIKKDNLERRDRLEKEYQDFKKIKNPSLIKEENYSIVVNKQEFERFKSELQNTIDSLKIYSREKLSKDIDDIKSKIKSVSDRNNFDYNKYPLLTKVLPLIHPNVDTALWVIDKSEERGELEDKLKEVLSIINEPINEILKKVLSGYSKYETLVEDIPDFYKVSSKFNEASSVEDIENNIINKISELNKIVQNPKESDKYYERRFSFSTEDDTYNVNGKYNNGNIDITFSSKKYSMEDANKGLFFKILPRVIDSISYMFSDLDYNTISFHPVSGESNKGRELRLKGYNIFAKRLFGEFSLVAENENTTIIPVPEMFKNRIYIKENIYQKERGLLETKAETIQEPGTVASKTTAQIPLSDTNIAKVLDGSKVVTTRKELIPDDTYLAGDTQQVKIKYLGIARVVGNSVVITNEKTKKSFVRTRDQFAKAEGFKNWSDYTDNNRFIQGFIKGDNTRYVYEISPAGRIQQMGTGQQRINPENNPVIGLFNEELERTNGVYPKEFIYESSEGTNKYVLSENNLYNLVDIDTGSIYLRNIDLTTGNIVSDPLPQTPVGKDSITKFIDTLNSQIKEYRIDIVLANKGIDVNEIIDRAENVNSEEELNELRILINKNLC